MKKHLILLLSLCAVSPVVYGMEENGQPTPMEASITNVEGPSVTQNAPQPTVTETPHHRGRSQSRDHHQAVDGSALPEHHHHLGDKVAEKVAVIETKSEAKEIAQEEAEAGKRRADENAAKEGSTTTSEVAPTEKKGEETQPELTPEEAARLSKVAQDAAAAGAKREKDAQPGRCKRAFNAVKSATGKVVCAPWEGLKFAWTNKGVLNPKTAYTKAWDSIKNASPKQFARKMIADIWNTIWGQAPVLPGFQYAHAHPENKVNDLTHALRAQGRAVNAAKSYTVKRTIGFGALAAAIGSGIAYHKFGASVKTACAGLGSCALGGLFSNLYLRSRAQVGEIARRHEASVLLATNAQVTTLEANEASNAALTDQAEQKHWFNALREFGICGCSDMRSMRNQIEHNYLVLHPNAQ